MKKLIVILLLFPFTLFGQHYYPMFKMIVLYPKTHDSNYIPVDNIIEVTDSVVYIHGDSTKLPLFKCNFRLPVGDEKLVWEFEDQTVKVMRDKQGYKYLLKRKEEWVFFWTTFEEDLSLLNGR